VRTCAARGESVINISGRFAGRREGAIAVRLLLASQAAKRTCVAGHKVARGLLMISQSPL
jgi:hypothetical protein